MSDQHDYRVQDTSNTEQVGQAPLDIVEASVEDREHQNLNENELEMIAGGANPAAEIFHDARPNFHNSLAQRWHNLPTAYKAEGIASTVAGPATALTVGVVGGVIANKASKG